MDLSAHLRLKALQALQMLLGLAQLDLQVDYFARFFLKSFKQPVFSSLAHLHHIRVLEGVTCLIMLLRIYTSAITLLLLFSHELVDTLQISVLGLRQLLRFLQLNLKILILERLDMQLLLEVVDLADLE